MSETAMLPAITPDFLLRARTRAVRELRPVPTVVAEDLAITPETCLYLLAGSLRWQIVQPAELAAMNPDFDAISFGEAVTRQVLPCRDKDGKLFVVVYDPFEPGLVPWVEDRLVEPFVWRLAEESALSAMLGAQDEARHTVSALQLGDVEAAGEAEDILVVTLPPETAG